jgi:putative DNA primase/helicase
MEFLHRIMGGNEAMMSYLARAAGYALTGDTREQCLFFLHGQGRNGKTVLLRLLLAALGHYAQTAPIETFLSSMTYRHPAELADLEGARLVVASEPDADRHWNESRLKMLTGGDNVRARSMRQDFFEFTPKFKLVFLANHKPSFRGVNYAIRRRLQLIPFKETIGAEEDDKSLFEKLCEELGGILQWMIDGCLEWQRVGLRPPPEVSEATEQYLDQEDTFGQWLHECTERFAGAFSSSAALRNNCAGFVASRGETPMTEKAFAKEMEARGFVSRRTNVARGYEGVRLKVKEP